MYFEMSCRSISTLTAGYCLCPLAVFKKTSVCVLIFFTHWVDQENSLMTWFVVQTRLCRSHALCIQLDKIILHEFSTNK